MDRAAAKHCDLQRRLCSRGLNSFIYSTNIPQQSSRARRLHALQEIGNFSRQSDVITRQRSEERRVGKECVSTCRSRWSPYHYKKNIKHDKRATQSTNESHKYQLTIRYLTQPQ